MRKICGIFLVSVLNDSGFCRYKGFYDYAKLKGVDVGKPVGLDVVVDGTVPTGVVICFQLIFSN